MAHYGVDIISLITALLLQYLRPDLRPTALVWHGFDALAKRLQTWLDGGLPRHGSYAWGLAVLPLVLAAWLFAQLLAWLHPWLCWPWYTLVVLLTVNLADWGRDVRQVGGPLAANDLPLARQRLSERDILVTDDVLLPRRGIEYALEQAQRQIFGPLFWFVVLPGPSGALLYRVAHRLACDWHDDGVDARFGWLAQRALWLLDWLPARITAASFAVVGHFEEALDHGLRARRNAPLDLLIHTGSGAIGVRLPADGDAPETPDNHQPDADDLLSVLGLVWRALGLWLLVIFLFGFALALA